MTMNGENEQRRNRVPREVARQIDENLKRLYADQASDSLPESLTQLLDALRQKEAKSR
ncbi:MULTISPECIES: NepR family anti-sigma factor [unclassified Yoonia]|uniref:NepR family anti-sigma factor n=1 Tax=unclassified Yoonia TaxID=2629118 RepID=UPI002AFE8933|nr:MULTISPECIES: NepR family anti-sigma factor [unclassified Yoonia]